MCQGYLYDVENYSVDVHVSGIPVLCYSVGTQVSGIPVLYRVLQLQSGAHMSGISV